MARLIHSSGKKELDKDLLAFYCIHLTTTNTLHFRHTVTFLIALQTKQQNNY